MQNTGFVLPGFPSMGAWVSYGLGSLNENLPDVRRAARLARLRPQRPGQLERRLPARRAPGHDGPRRRREPDLRPLPAREAQCITPESERDGLDLLQQLNREHRRAAAGRFAARRPHRVLRAGRAAAARARRRCSTSRRRSAATQQLYGLDEPDHRGLRPQLPDRPPAAGARRAVRAGLERRRQRLPAPQLGLARGPRPRPRRHGPRAWTSPPPP